MHEKYFAQIWHFFAIVHHKFSRVLVLARRVLLSCLLISLGDCSILKTERVLNSIVYISADYCTKRDRGKGRKRRD